MSAHTVADAPPAPTPRSKGDWGWRLAKAVGLVGTALLIFLGVYIEVTYFPPNPVRVSASAAPDSVQVSVSVASVNPDASTDGPTLATHLITAPRIVADLFARINAFPSVGPLPMHCPLASPDAVSFGFRFRRAGALVETAIQPGTVGCDEWWLSAGGIREPIPRYDPDGERQTILSEVQPLGCPQAWVDQCDGH